MYNGGEWVPIEDCGRLLRDPGLARCGGDCARCPKNRADGGGAAATADDDGNDYDVAIIGAGCVGAAVARELSRYDLRVVLLEKSDDVTQGATKANSGIVHAGYDDKPGTNRAKFCWAGNQMYTQLDRELNFGFIRNGSLVVIVSEDQRPILEDLMDRARQNGVKRCRIVERDELFELEPNVTPKAIAALHSPDAGTVTPYEFTIALAENAAHNGVDIRVDTEVVGIEGEAGDFRIKTRHVPPPRGGGEGKAPAGIPLQQHAIAGAVVAAVLGTAVGMDVSGGPTAEQRRLMLLGLGLLLALAAILRAVLAPKPPPNFASKLKGEVAAAKAAAAAAAAGKIQVREVRARYVVNAAGLFADTVARMVGDSSFNIKPRLGEYLLLHKDQGKFIRHVIFPAPGKMGKGVVAQPTLWGNLLIGPLARELHDPKTEKASNKEILRELIAKTAATYPAFDPGMVIHSFTGARAKSDRGDWIIEESEACPGFVHAAGIDSPGLAGSPAIALEVVELLRGAGLDTRPNDCFNPYRRPIVQPKQGWKGLRLKGDDPTKKVLCKCELVTEAEIVDAIHRPLKCESTQAVRKRTRAGMGHCQGTYCESRVKEVIQRETGKPAEEVAQRPWPESSLLPERWVEDSFKDMLRGMKDGVAPKA